MVEFVLGEVEAGEAGEVRDLRAGDRGHRRESIDRRHCADEAMVRAASAPSCAERSVVEGPFLMAPPDN